MRARNKKLENIDRINHTLFSKLVESQELGRNTYVANATIAFIKESGSDRSHIDKPYFVKKIQNEQV